MLAARPRPVGPSGWTFPDPDGADEWGIVAVGADLEPATLVAAYRRGLFPWPHEGLPLPWFSPDPRAVIAVDSVHVARSLGRRLRACRWETTVDTAFALVVDGCRRAHADEGTWITDEMAAAYTTLHELGWAHSVEVWEDADLVGGIYGVQAGGCFTGESMFRVRADASKVALVDLAGRLRDAGGRVLDVQLPTPHLTAMGAVEVPRRDFLGALGSCRDDDIRLVVDRLPVSRLAR